MRLAAFRSRYIFKKQTASQPQQFASQVESYNVKFNFSSLFSAPSPQWRVPQGCTVVRGSGSVLHAHWEHTLTTSQGKEYAVEGGVSMGESG